MARPGGALAGGGAAPGFQSWPVEALYSAFKASKVVTSALTWSAGALAVFRDLTLSPWAAILVLKSSEGGVALGAVGLVWSLTQLYIFC